MEKGEERGQSCEKKGRKKLKATGYYFHVFLSA